MTRPGSKNHHNISEAQFVVLLHSIPQLGDKSIHRLLRLTAQRRLDGDTFLRLSAGTLRTDYSLDSRSVEYLIGRSTELLARSEEILRELHTHSIQILTIDSATYPARLDRNDDAPPPIVYAMGNLAVLRAPEPEPRHFTFCTAVSNGAGQEAMSAQDAIASKLIEAGGVPVTGHDRAAFQRLALVAQRRNLPVAYVFDRGLREALGPQFDRSPFASARIRDAEFVRERDLALSPFRISDHALGANNRRRDRLMFSLADVVIAIDVRAGGRLEAESKRCLDQHRPIFALQGGRDGNRSLIAAGATPIQDPSAWLPGLFESLDSQHR